MILLVLAGLIWLVLHIGVSGTALRDRIAVAIGEGPFRGAFSVASIASIVFLVFAYNHAATRVFWAAPAWLIELADLAMLAACLLFVAAVSPSNPTMTGTETAFGTAPRGMFRITRHPMLCAFGIWAGVHMLVNGDGASLLFFGVFLVTVLSGIPSIDAKLARRDPAKWAALSGLTSAVPFAAILAGRNRFVAREIGWRSPLLSLVLWLALIALHPVVIGVSPLPMR